MKAEEVEEVEEEVAGQKMVVGFLRMSGRFGLDGGLLADQRRVGCSRSRLTDNVVLRMQLGTWRWCRRRLPSQRVSGPCRRSQSIGINGDGDDLLLLILLDHTVPIELSATEYLRHIIRGFGVDGNPGKNSNAFRYGCQMGEQGDPRLASRMSLTAPIIACKSFKISI